MFTFKMQFTTEGVKISVKNGDVYEVIPLADFLYQVGITQTKFFELLNSSVFDPKTFNLTSDITVEEVAP